MAEANIVVDISPYLSKAMMDVSQERIRQVEHHGFDAHNDDGYLNGELVRAAACYAEVSVTPRYAEKVASLKNLKLMPSFSSWCLWPFSEAWWKPGNRRRNLVKAAALLIAEVERIDRMAEEG